MGFAAEIVFVLRLGLVVFGPKRLRAMPGGVVPAKQNSKKSEAAQPSLQQALHSGSSVVSDGAVCPKCTGR
jgi:Sec-independent protein translocase protein TatA